MQEVIAFPGGTAYHPEWIVLEWEVPGTSCDPVKTAFRWAQEAHADEELLRMLSAFTDS